MAQVTMLSASQISRFLANPDATTLLVVGTGSQAPYQIMA